MSETRAAIEARGLTKVFHGKPAVDSLDLTVWRGEVLGLLGPNGAGKTTTIQMLLGITAQSAGSISILGMDMARHRREILSRVNFSSAYTAMPSNLTVWENLNVYAALYGVRERRKRIAAVLELLEIDTDMKAITGSLSSGQLTRLNLCKALLNDPEVLFLDEPTASLDPDIADKVRSGLCSIQKNRGTTLLYTSHNMAEVEALCDRIVFLRQGRKVAEGTPAEVKRAASADSLESVFIGIARGRLGAGEGI